jgi:hypothetical protein
MFDETVRRRGIRDDARENRAFGEARNGVAADNRLAFPRRRQQIPQRIASGVLPDA